jgi:hypothetical protein
MTMEVCITTTATNVEKDVAKDVTKEVANVKDVSEKLIDVIAIATALEVAVIAVPLPLPHAHPHPHPHPHPHAHLVLVLVLHALRVVAQTKEATMTIMENGALIIRTRAIAAAPPQPALVAHQALPKKSVGMIVQNAHGAAPTSITARVPSQMNQQKRNVSTNAPAMDAADGHALIVPIQVQLIHVTVAPPAIVPIQAQLIHVTVAPAAIAHLQLLLVNVFV